MNNYLLYLDKKYKDSENQFLVYDILFYAFVSAGTVAFCSLFDFSTLLAKAIELVSSMLL